MRAHTVLEWPVDFIDVLPQKPQTWEGNKGKMLFRDRRTSSTVMNNIFKGR